MLTRVQRILLSHALTGFICWYGVEKVFEKSIGISTFGISLLAVVYIATSAVLNVPTGVLADKYGRKYAIMLATGVLLLSSITGGMATNFWMYLISIVLWGLFYTIQNGAYEAILYDTLKVEGRTDSYARFSGLSSALFWVAIFLSSIVGAWVGNRYGLRWAYFVTIIPNVLNIALAFYLIEPHVPHEHAAASSRSLLLQGFRFLRSSRDIFLLAAVYLFIELYGWTTNEFGQLYFIELGFSILVIGILNAVSGLSQSIGNFVGHRFGNISGRIVVIGLGALMVLTFCLPVRLRVVGTALLLGLMLVRNVFFISVNTRLQHVLPSRIRSTTLSSLGMMNDGLVVVGYLGFGAISQQTTVRTGFLVIAAYGLVVVAIALLITRVARFRRQLVPQVSHEFVPEEIDSVPK